MKQIKLIIIHCADTPNGRHNTVEDIDSWHAERGFTRSSEARRRFNSELGHIGYQYVIYVDGSIHTGRADDEIGAHAAGYNSTSIGICLIGKDQFTEAQWTALRNLLVVKIDEYPDARVIGHYAVATNGKTCPNFQVEDYVADGLIPNEYAVLA